jgi:hypothetical protein
MTRSFSFAPLFLPVEGLPPWTLHLSGRASTFSSNAAGVLPVYLPDGFLIESLQSVYEAQGVSSGFTLYANEITSSEFPLQTLHLIVEANQIADTGGKIEFDTPSPAQGSYTFVENDKYAYFIAFSVDPYNPPSKIPTQVTVFGFVIRGV